MIRPPLPGWRRGLLNAATVLLLGVYYLHYGSDFDEGENAPGGVASLLLRLLAVSGMFVALMPLSTPDRRTWGLSLLYAACGVSYSLAAAWTGSPNDVLFLNTLLQVPVLWALTQTRWDIDLPRWFRFVGTVLTVEVAIDIAVWQFGQTLWLSQAFVGGLGNPSSFGLACALVFAFALFHPAAGRWRGPLAVSMVVGAGMSKSLFAVLAIALTLFVWALLRRRRLTVLAPLLLALGALQSAVLTDEGDEAGFLLNKIDAAAALLGLAAGDSSSSASVYQRTEMHEQTFAAFADEPLRLLWGHLDRLAYWPMDSQLLSYAGSFGIVALALFLGLHSAWLQAAWRMRRRDGGFAVVALTLFLLIFLTNRILDYFPLATLYFVCIAIACATDARGAALRPARASPPPRRDRRRGGDANVLSAGSPAMPPARP